MPARSPRRSPARSSGRSCARATASSTSRADGVTLFGYCLGATLGAISAAANPRLPIVNMIGMATPIDLRKATGVTFLFDPDRFNPDDVLDETGNVSPSTIRTTFQTLR